MNSLRIDLNKNFYLTSFNKKIAKHGNYYKWSENQKVVFFNTHGQFPKSKDSIDSFFNEIDNNTILCMAIIHVVREENQIASEEVRHIGNVSLQCFDWINRSAELAIIIGEQKYLSRGLGKLACKAMVEHGFNKLNLHRIWGGCAAENIGMNRIFEKLDFKKEGEFRDAVFLNGNYQNIVQYGVLNND